MTRAILFGVCLLAGSSLHAAQPALPAPPLGRLFFTPAERAQLDVARTQKKVPEVASAAAAEPPPAEPAPQVVTYGGIVRRSDGSSTLWINNRAVDAKEALSGLNLKGKVRPDGAMTLQVPQTGGTIDVKVGQSVELQSGRVAEVRKPAPDSKPTSEAAPPADAKGAVEAKAAPQVKPEPPAAATTQSPQPAEKPGGGVGLKLDLGGRTLTPAESQRLTSAPPR